MNENTNPKLIISKRKLQDSLKIFFTNKEYSELIFFTIHLDKLKNEYQSDNNVLQFLNRATDNIPIIISKESVSRYINSLSITNLQNNEFIDELLNFISPEYKQSSELEEKIMNLEERVKQLEKIMNLEE